MSTRCLVPKPRLQRWYHVSRRFISITANAKTHKSVTTSTLAQSGNGSKRPAPETWAKLKEYFSLPARSGTGEFKLGDQVTVHGFLGKRRELSSKLIFVDVTQPQAESSPISLRSTWSVKGSPEHEAHLALKALPSYSAVSVTGIVAEIENEAPVNSGTPDVRLDLSSAKVLSPFPKDIIVSPGVVFPPTRRHLQMRFSQHLRQRLLFRSAVGDKLRKELGSTGIVEFETPMLFKSTPEGAREFVVPTRRPGFAYALPQSPQQFKQMLMAGGFNGYFQLARCFRDEDLRADRQPEFTQLDLEMAFATGETVMRTVEDLVKKLLSWLRENWTLESRDGELIPLPLPRQANLSGESSGFPDLSGAPFTRMSYNDAMTRYGSDKPDLRIPGDITRIEHILPGDFIGKITSLDRPNVEAWKLRLDGTLNDSRNFVKRFFDTLPKTLARNPDGAPAVMVFDVQHPLSGLSPLGHEAASILSSGEDEFEALGPFEDGDILVVQARRSGGFQGGSTALGELRAALYREAVEQGLVPRDDGFMFLWITDFPMFTPDEEVELGQQGAAGFSATHHPFTAPLTDRDFDLLLEDPLKAKADHYDLVLNGVEIGGGSRRIHIAEVQEFVMRDILKMSDDGVAQFSHLLEALRAGCPPHAGFALGFDRLVAVLCGASSVRDVIAFPKSMKGEDLAVRSPGRITAKQLETYHLTSQQLSKQTE